MADNERILRQAAVDLGVGMGTIVGRGRVIVPRDPSRLRPAIELRFIYHQNNQSLFDYAELPGDTRQPVDVIRLLDDWFSGATLKVNPDGRMELVEVKAVRPRVMNEYAVTTSAHVSLGAPVVVNGLLAGMVLDQEGRH